MIRPFVWSLVVAVSSCGAASAQYAHPYAAACRVTVQKNGRKIVGGSGVLIAVQDGRALVLTVKHVALAAGKPVACNWNGQVMRGSVLAVHPSADVALLLVAAPVGVRPAVVALPSAQSAPFVLAGFPGHDRERLRFQVGAFVGVTDNRLVVTCRPERGMSGGPAFDRYGRVCGTVSAFGLNYGYCGSGREMAELIQKYVK